MNILKMFLKTLPASLKRLTAPESPPIRGEYEVSYTIYTGKPHPGDGPFAEKSYLLQALPGLIMSIPSVGIERLRLVAKIQNRKRKMSTIFKGQTNDRLHAYHNMLDRQCSMVEYQSQCQAIPFQRLLVDTRSYALALTERGEHNLRQCKSLEDLPPYGLYQGAAQRELRYDIERIKDEYRPEKVRARKAAKLVRDGTKQGKILPQQEVPFKFQDLMTRNYDHEKGRFETKGSHNRPGVDSAGMSLPPISADRSLVSLKTKSTNLQGLKRSHTYCGP